MDDHRVLAAELEDRRRQVLRGGLVDDLADAGAPGEEDEVPVLREQRRRFGNGTLDHGERLWIEVLGHQLAEQLGRGDGDLRWLDHGGVARCYGRDEWADREHERLVPRADDQRHAERIVAHLQVPRLEQERRVGMLRLHPLVEVLQGVVDLLDVELHVHEIGVDLVTTEVLGQGVVHRLTVLGDHRPHGLELRDAPCRRSRGTREEIRHVEQPPGRCSQGQPSQDASSVARVPVRRLVGSRAGTKAAPEKPATHRPNRSIRPRGLDASGTRAARSGARATMTASVTSPVASSQPSVRSARNHVRWRFAKARLHRTSSSTAASSVRSPSRTAQASW